MKITKDEAERGDNGQLLLAAGKGVAMRMWDAEAPNGDGKSMHATPYETVGYALSGRARLHMNDETIELVPGTSWLVPADTEHRYEIMEAFSAVEATTPPAREM